MPRDWCIELPDASNALSQRGKLRWCRDKYESMYVSDVASLTTIVDRTNTIATRSSAANLATEMMDEVPRATTQSISPLGRPPVHRWLHHNESMTAAAAAAQRENDVAARLRWKQSTRLSSAAKYPQMHPWSRPATRGLSGRGSVRSWHRTLPSNAPAARHSECPPRWHRR